MLRATIFLLTRETGAWVNIMNADVLRQKRRLSRYAARRGPNILVFTYPNQTNARKRQAELYFQHSRKKDILTRQIIHCRRLRLVSFFRLFLFHYFVTILPIIVRPNLNCRGLSIPAVRWTLCVALVLRRHQHLHVLALLYLCLV